MILIPQKAEHNNTGVNCGIMNQYANMFGNKDNDLQLNCRTIEFKHYKIDFKNHQLVLINTNVEQILSDSAYNDRRYACETISELLGIKALRDATKADLETYKRQVYTG
jgi:galactokinase